MRRVLIKPMAFLDHFKRGERLLRLIVIVELPGQISDREQNDDQCRDNPERPAIFESAFCHVGRSRDIPRSYLRAMPRDPSTPLGMTVMSIQLRQSTARTGAPSAPAIFRGSAAKL